MSDESEPRRMPVRSRLVEMDGDYSGFHATMRVNISIKQAEALSSDLDDICATLAGIILDWNFVDESGAPLPLGDETTPHQAEIIIDGLRSLPMDLLRMLQVKYGEVLRSPLAEATSPDS
jgi:hypothetical protein